MSAEYGILFDLNKFKKYEKSNRKQSFHYMAPRLYNALPAYLRMYPSVETFDNWKLRYDLLLDSILDNPITGPNDSGLCEYHTSKQTNSLLYWTPFLGKSGRHANIDISIYI